MGHGPLIERFYASTKEGPGACLTWAANVNVDGYGTITHRGKYLLAHRVAWEIISGKPPVGLICHTCDRPSCVRFEHLYDGTAQSNMKDRDVRGRQARGQRGGLAKLNDSDIPKIRERLAQRETLRSIARDFGVSPASISNIKSGFTWVHIS